MFHIKVELFSFPNQFEGSPIFFLFPLVTSKTQGKFSTTGLLFISVGSPENIGPLMDLAALAMTSFAGESLVNSDWRGWPPNDALILFSWTQCVCVRWTHQIYGSFKILNWIGQSRSVWNKPVELIHSEVAFKFSDALNLIWEPSKEEISAQDK